MYDVFSKYASIAVFSLAAGTAFAADTAVVNFNTASHKLVGPAHSILAEFAKDHAGSCFNLEGHTDTRGSLPYNQALSERRVRSVVDYLLTQNVNTDITQADAAGETQLLVNKTGDVLSNRRVVISAYDCAGPVGSKPSLTWLAGLPLICLAGACSNSTATATTTTTTTTTN